MIGTVHIDLYVIQPMCRKLKCLEYYNEHINCTQKCMVLSRVKNHLFWNKSFESWRAPKHFNFLYTGLKTCRSRWMTPIINLVH